MNKEVVIAIFIALVICVLFLIENIYTKPSSKIIFLTFDGDMTYHMQKQQKSGLVKQWYDPTLIEYLKKNKIPATFFITGMFAEMYPDLVRELAANSYFSIQNHTYDHHSFEPDCFHLPVVKTDQQKKTEIEKTQKILKSLTSHTPTYFRYPGLCHNTSDDATIKAEGLSVVPGQIISGDAYMKKPEAIVNNVLHNLIKGNVIIFHLGTIKTPATTEAVKILVPKLKELGYAFDIL